MPPCEGIADAMPKGARVFAFNRKGLTGQVRRHRKREVFPTRSMLAFEPIRTNELAEQR